MAHGLHPHRSDRSLAAPLLVLLLICTAPRVQSEVPDGSRAVVTDLSGSVRYSHKGFERALAVLDTLERSDRLALAPGSRVEIVFSVVGAQVLELHGPCQAVVRANDLLATPPCLIERRDLAGAWRDLRIGPGPLGKASVSMRGAARSRMRLLAPVGLQLAAPRRLRWQAPLGGDPHDWQYTVQLVDALGQAVYSDTVRQTFADLPPTLALAPPGSYLWSIEASAPGAGHAHAAAEFQILAPDAQPLLRALQQSVAQARPDPQHARASAEEVLLAIALEQAGLANDAEAQWQMLGQARAAIALRRPPASPEASVR